MFVKMLTATIFAATMLACAEPTAQRVIHHIEAMNGYRVAIGEIASPRALTNHATSARIDALVDGLGNEAIAVSRLPLPPSSEKWIPLQCYDAACANNGTGQNGGAK